MEKWNKQVNATMGVSFSATSPITGKKQDIGVSLFADDLKKTMVGGTVAEHSGNNNWANRLLNYHCNPKGLHQNMSKQEIQYHFAGIGSRARRGEFISQAVGLPGELTHISRYLGGRFHVDLWAHVEVTNRLNAIKIG